MQLKKEEDGTKMWCIEDKNNVLPNADNGRLFDNAVTSFTMSFALYLRNCADFADSRFKLVLHNTNVGEEKR
jgi:hypothetical protein